MTISRSAWRKCVAGGLLSIGFCALASWAQSSPACGSSEPASASAAVDVPTTAPITVTVTVTASDRPAPSTTEKPLRTEQFESGQLRLSDASSHQLEVFLRDLNQRRDYDYSQHAEQPGPNHEYLTRWIDMVIGELSHRGYSFDANGELHRRDATVVPTR